MNAVGSFLLWVQTGGAQLSSHRHGGASMGALCSVRWVDWQRAGKGRTDSWDGGTDQQQDQEVPS